MIRYESTIEHAVEAGLQLRVIPLEFLGQEAGLPKGCENLDSLPSMDLVKGFYAACAMLEARVKKLMAELQPKPSCIVSTNALPWTQRVADSFNIPRYLFETISCFAILSWLAFDKEHGVKDEEGSLVDQIKIARRRARATLMNSFDTVPSVGGRVSDALWVELDSGGSGGGCAHDHLADALGSVPQREIHRGRAQDRGESRGRR